MSDTSMTASSIFVQTDEKLGNHQQFDGTAMSSVSVAVFFFKFRLERKANLTHLLFYFGILFYIMFLLQSLALYYASVIGTYKLQQHV